MPVDLTAIPAPDPAAEALEAALAFNRAVADETRVLRIRKAAQDRFRAEQEPEQPPFDAGTLAELLARPVDPPMRAEGLIPSDAGTLVVAQRKTGKTTLELNYARSLLTGEDFLGRFPVRRIAGAVALLNYEVSGSMIARWADDVGVPRERLYVVNLRGRRNPLTHPGDRLRLAEDLRARDTHALVVDPFGRAYGGKSQNDSGEVGAFLSDLDVFARAEVGASDLMLSAHAGWNGERTRGASALEDWADVIVTLTRDPDDETVRFLRAIGRDVEVEEDRLDFDPATRLLSMSGAGSRRKAKGDRKSTELAVFVVRAAKADPGVNVAGLKAAIRGMDDAPTFRGDEMQRAVKHAVECGHLRVETEGQGRPTRHFPGEQATRSSASVPKTDGTGHPTSPVSTVGDPFHPFHTRSGTGPVTRSTRSIGERVRVGSGEATHSMERVVATAAQDKADLEDHQQCSNCKAVLSEMRADYGKSTCVDCERRSSA